MANILSLFDGMSCGMLAMMGAGVEVENYYAYEIDKYAIQTATHNFPQIQELGDVFNANFIQYKGVDYLIGGSPCVPANTKIKTDKGYKRIDNIKIGDMVLTHKNRYRPVSRLYKRQTDHLYHIKFNGNQTLNITGNHPIYVYRNNKFKFIRTDELTTDDFVCININGGKNKLPYSDDILWLVGRAIADGYLSNDKNIIVISVGKKKIDEFENRLLEIPYYITHKDRAAPEYYIKSKELTELYSYFGNNIAINKYIPDEILNLSKEQLLKIWEGYISGDGFVRKDRPNTVMWCSSSEDLILSMGLLTAKLFGKYPTTTIRLGEYKKMPSGMCYTNDSYNSQISITDRVNPDCMIITDKLLIRIKNIEKENITTDVYNIETAQDHSYTVNNCIVHNCTYWSIAQSPDKRETTASGIGWELFSQYVRALHEAKPKFFIYENNKSMSKAIRESITQTFGFEAICINSALVSAQNRQRLYWVGKRNADGTYSKVDVEQPDDRGILLRDVLDGADLTNCDKSYCLTSSYDGACAWNTIERHQRTMVAEPVNVTADGKAQCLRATCYKDGVRNIAGNDIDKKTGVAEPVCIASRGRYSDTDSRSSKTDAPTYQHYEARTDSKTNAITTVSKDNLIGEPVRCFTLPREDGVQTQSKQYRVYETSGKSTTLCAEGGGMGAKTGLYAMPVLKVREATKKGYIEVNCEECYDYEQPNSKTRRGRRMGEKSNCLTTSCNFYQYIAYVVKFDENGNPTKAVSSADSKTYTVYEVKNGNITIKGKTYPIKLVDGYYIIRKLTVSECKRLQTVPEWYEFPVSNTQAYRQLGAGWTVDVIVHLIKATLQNKEIRIVE